MKNVLKISLILGIVMFTNSVNAQNNKDKIVTDTLMVKGICGMCEERIENAALIKGVKKVEWSSSTEELIVVYRADKVTLDEIAWEITEAGHDNAIYTCTDEQYDSVHNCCKYRTQEGH